MKSKSTLALTEFPDCLAESVVTGCVCFQSFVFSPYENCVLTKALAFDDMKGESTPKAIKISNLEIFFKKTSAFRKKGRLYLG